MKHVLIVLAILISNFSFGQTENYLNKYPFNKAATIMIAEFIDAKFINDTLSAVTCREIPKSDNKVNVGKFEKTVKIYKSDYQNLANIIFAKPLEVSDVNKITDKDYNEHGYAILFFDESGNVFEYIQFCYNAKIVYLSFPHSQLMNGDYSKFSLLKKLFLDNGIKIVEYRKGC